MAALVQLGDPLATRASPRGRPVKRHLEGILNAIVLGATNARSEAVNAKIQWIKYTARGFRNRDRFRAAIYFHLGEPDLYPEGVGLSPTHAVVVVIGFSKPLSEKVLRRA